MRTAVARINRETRFTKAAVAACAGVLLLAGCQSGGTGEAGEDYPSEQMTVYSGFDPGGGIDLAINAVTQSLDEEGTVEVPMKLAHQPGGSGLTATAMMASDFRGEDNTLFLTSVSTLSASLSEGGDVKLQDLVPLAGLFAEYTYVYVPKDSPYQSLEDLVEAIEQDPKSVEISGASLGSADTMVVAQLARAIGLSFEDLTYVPLTGGQNETNLLGGQVDVAFGGPDLLGLVDSGDVRVVAVSSEEPLKAEKVADIPTFQSAGYDVAQANWRGVFGPPDMPKYAVDYWSRTLSQLDENPAWQGSMETNIWDDQVMNKAEFEKFLSTEEENLQQDLDDLGLLK